MLSQKWTNFNLKENGLKGSGLQLNIHHRDISKISALVSVKKDGNDFDTKTNSIWKSQESLHELYIIWKVINCTIHLDDNFINNNDFPIDLTMHLSDRIYHIESIVYTLHHDQFVYLRRLLIQQTSSSFLLHK